MTLNAATLATDKPDYAPGQYVTFSGTGWQPGETVKIEVYETSVDPTFFEGSVSAIADANGNILNSTFQVQPSFLGQGFLAYATGLTSGLSAQAQFTDSNVETFDQFQNGNPVVTGGGAWINGALNSTHSTYAEGMSVPQRLLLTGLSGSSHTLLISVLATKGGYHAYDFLTSWQQAKQASDTLVAPALDLMRDLFPLECGNLKASDTTLCNTLHGTSGYSAVMPITGDMGTVPSLPGSTENVQSRADVYAGLFGTRTATIYATAPISGTFAFTGYTAGSGEYYANYLVSWTSSADSVLLEVAGHLAETTGQPITLAYTNSGGAALVSGGPYHFKLQQLDGANIGNEDNQIQAGTILPGPPICALTAPPTTCAGATATFTASVSSGGAAPFTFVWTKGTTILSSGGRITITTDSTAGTSTLSIANATASDADTYSVSITDKNGLTTLTPCTGLLVVDTVTLSLSETDVNCTGGSDGTITATFSGTAPFAISLDNGTPIQNVTSPYAFTPVGVGPHTVTVTDANACMALGSTNVGQPTAVAVTATPTQPQCNGSTDGSIAASASGGTPGYTFSKDGITYQATGTFSGLAAGNYTIYAKDSHGCVASTPVTIGQPSSVAVTATPTQPQCNGGTDGSIAASASGGTPGYTFSKDGTTYQATGTFSSLAAGNYTIYAKDSHGCVASTPVTIGQPSSVAVTATPTQPQCNGSTDGSIAASASGGTPGYTFSKDGTTYQASGTFSGLAAGNYTIYAKDSHGCVASTPVTIGQPDSVAVTATPTQPQCNGGTDGSIAASASGGTPGYTFSKDGTTYQASGTFSSLAAGNYTIYAKDSHGCVASTPVIIGQPSSVAVTATPTQPQCNGGTDGSIAASASGGTPGYTFSKDGTTYQDTGAFSSLAAGNYTIYAKDSHGCVASTPVTIGQPSSVVVTATPTQPQCNGSTDGSIAASASGGTPGYTFSKDGTTYQATGAFSSLAAGNYTIYAKDSHGCVASTPVTIGQPSSVVVTATPTQPQCNGSTDGSIAASASGGTPGYTFSKDGTTYQDTGAFSSLAAGNYTIYAKDSHGCVASTPVTIGAPSSVVVTATPTQPQCNGGTDGSIAASASGGTPGYTFSKDGTTYQASGTFSSLAAGNYTIYAKDSHGCVASTPVVIGAPTALTCTVDGDTQVVVGSKANQLTVTVTGGSGPYTCSFAANKSDWVITDPNTYPGNGPTFTVTYSAPTAASSVKFTVTVTDAHNCTTTCYLTVSALFKSFVTDSMLCTFSGQFRLIFGQDPQNMPCYKLNASNPGQFYYNMAFWGTPGESMTFTFTVPYPFVTQGAQPIHAYDGVTVSTRSDGNYCLIPGNPFFVDGTQVTLADYNPQSMGSSKQISVSLTIPASGFVYLNIHLDYGLKQSTGYAQDGKLDVLACGTSGPILIHNGESYTFGYAATTDGNTITDSQAVQSANSNVFEKNPGVAGLVTSTSQGGNPVPGATAALYDASGRLVLSGVTDINGWYMLNYKYTGKAATFVVKLWAPGKATTTPPDLTANITLKANGFVVTPFTLP